MKSIYLTDNEVAMHSMEEALELVKLLVNNGYVAAVSVEEQLIIVNYVWTPRFADRNEIVFQSREELYEVLNNSYELGYKDGKEDIVNEIKGSQELD